MKTGADSLELKNRDIRIHDFEIETTQHLNSLLSKHPDSLMIEIDDQFKTYKLTMPTNKRRRFFELKFEYNFRGDLMKMTSIEIVF